MEIWGVIMGQLLQCISVVVQFYPWFRFDFLLFQLIIIHYNTQKQKKIKFKPKIKSNHNINTSQYTTSTFP